MNKQNYIDIATIISDGDNEIISLTKQIIEDPVEFYHKHKEALLEKYFYNDDEIKKMETSRLIWYELIQVLCEKDFLASRDWKDELEDFLYFVGDLKTTKKFKFDIEKIGEDFDENDSIPEWSSKINNILKDTDYVLVNIDHGGDVYNLFLCRKDKFEKLEKLIKKMGDELTIMKD